MKLRKAASTALDSLSSLRVKIALLNLLVFGVILTALCALVLSVRERYLRDDFDDRLRDRALSIGEIYRASAEGPQQMRPTRAYGLRSLRFPGYYFQVRDAEGRILERSHNLGLRNLPLGAEVRGAKSAGEHFETLTGDPERTPPNAGDLRMLTVFQPSPGGGGNYLQVASSLQPVRGAIVSLRRLFAVAVGAGLLVAGASSWFLARRSLRPIGKVARKARELTAASLDQRIEVPPGHDEIAELVVVINQMLDRLQAAFLAQERFISDVSHEFRTPLSVLLGEAQVLNQQARTAEEYDRFIASVQDEMRRLGQVVDSLLALARAHAGFPLPSAIPLSVNEIAMDAVERCKALAKQREVRLTPVLALPEPDEEELLVTGDAELLRTMLVNLLRNAIRFSPVEEAVELRVTRGSRTVEVAVLDRGQGVAPDHIPKLFDRFYRVPSDGEPSPGSGLGLALAKAVAELHHGQLTGSAREGGGCLFRVSLPLAGQSGRD